MLHSCVLNKLGCFFVAGVEYIVSDKIFETLPSNEQKLWHSHAYEVFELQLRDSAFACMHFFFKIVIYI